MIHLPSCPDLSLRLATYYSWEMYRDTYSFVAEVELGEGELFLNRELYFSAKGTYKLFTVWDLASEDYSFPEEKLEETHRYPRDLLITGLEDLLGINPLASAVAAEEIEAVFRSIRRAQAREIESVRQAVERFPGSPEVVNLRFTDLERSELDAFEARLTDELQAVLA